MSERHPFGHSQQDQRFTMMGYYSNYPPPPHQYHPPPSYPPVTMHPSPAYVTSPAPSVYPYLALPHHQPPSPVPVVSHSMNLYHSRLSSGTSIPQQARRPAIDVDRAHVTYTGHIKTLTDAILLLAACDLPGDASAMASGAGSKNASASLPPRRLDRRLLESERADLIQPGSIFVWDEKEAGMRRWTDGKCWSASRVSGCFLTYRELEARKRSAHDINGPRSNQYKVEGLVKQSFSMTTTSGRKLHMVSYYTKRDVRERRLRRVSEDPRFVGEAGGEWGLSVDEEEFPDPVIAGNEQAAAVAAQVGKSKEHEQQQPRESSASDQGSSRPRHNIYSTSPQVSYHPPSVLQIAQLPMAPSAQTRIQGSVCPSFPPIQHPVRSTSGFKRPPSGQNGHATAPMPRLSPLKRMRSLSAGDFVSAKRPGPTTLAPPSTAADFALRRQQSVSLSSISLSESNMRAAGRHSRPLPRPHKHGMSFAVSGSTPRTVEMPALEQDSAAGDLLRLRSFSLAAPSANNKSLTSPEDAAHTPSGTNGDMPAAVVASKAMAPNAVGKSQQLHRPIGPSRAKSDHYALCKFGTRI